MVASIDSSTLSSLGLRSTQDSQASVDENALGQDAFLKLMVAQLRNQDPMKPWRTANF